MQDFEKLQSSGFMPAFGAKIAPSAPLKRRNESSGHSGVLPKGEELPRQVCVQLNWGWINPAPAAETVLIRESQVRRRVEVCGVCKVTPKHMLKLISIDCVLDHSFLSLSWSKNRSLKDGTATGSLQDILDQGSPK